METKKYSESNYDHEKFAEKLDQLLTHDLPVRLSNLLADRIAKPTFFKKLIEEDAETFGDKSPDYIATSMANYLIDKSEKNPAYAGLIMLLTDFNNELSQLVNELEGVSTDVHKIDDKLVKIMPTIQKFSGQVEGFKVATESYQAIAQDLRTNFNKLASIEKVELLIGQSSNKLSNDFRVVIEGQDGKGGLRSELTNLDKSNISLAKTVEELANKIGDHYNNTGLAGQLNNLEAKLVDSEKQLSSDITKSNQELTEKINDLEKNFTASISESNQELTEKINDLDKKLTEKINDLENKLTGWKSVMPNIVTILIVLVGLWGGFASMSGNIKDGVKSDLQLLLERELKQEDGILSNRMKTIEDKIDQMETRIIEQIKNED